MKWHGVVKGGDVVEPAAAFPSSNRNGATSYNGCPACIETYKG